MEKLDRQVELLEFVELIRMCFEEPCMLLMLCFVLIIVKYSIFLFVLTVSAFFVNPLEVVVIE